MKKPTFFSKPLITAIIAAASISTVHAAPTSWNGSISDNWFEPQNWDNLLVPTSEYAIQISNGDTVLLTGNSGANTQHLYLGLEGEGHLVSEGTDLNAGQITFAHNESQAINSAASLVVNNADINSPDGINLLKAKLAGNKTVSFSHSNGTLNTSSFDHRGDLVAVDEAVLDSSLMLRNVVVNTTNRENILAGDVEIDSGSDGSVISVTSNIGLYDVTWTSNPKLDLEIGSDISTDSSVVNSSLTSTTNMIVERSTILADWLEFAEYTSTRSGWQEVSGNNSIDNAVSAIFTDSDIDLNYRMIMGDVGADNLGDVVKGLVDVTFVNSTLDVRFDIQLTDIRVENGARGEDRAFLTAVNSEIRIGDLLEIASYGSIYPEATGILEAGVTLKNSLLQVNDVIQIADVDQELGGNNFVLGADDSVSAELKAESSLITAQRVASGSEGSQGLLSLKNSYLSLTDTDDEDNAADFNLLEASEGVLKLMNGSKLVMSIDGNTRGNANNARNGSELYSAIDALQVTLNGELEVNLAENLGNEDAEFDLIRVAKLSGIELAEDAFNGIQGDFDKVIINGLADKAEATTAIVQETIDGTEYDVYRVTVAGSLSFYAAGFLLMFAGLFRTRK